MSKACSLELVALEHPGLFAKSIRIGKAEQGREGAAGRGQSLSKEESETFLLVCHLSRSKGW